MALAPLQQLQLDEVGDSAYMCCSTVKLICISKELVVSGVKGIELEKVEKPGVISISFEVRDFLEGIDVDVPVLILDISEDSEVCGIEIPHYSHFSQWLVPQVTTPPNPL